MKEGWKEGGKGKEGKERKKKKEKTLMHVVSLL